MHAVGGPSRYGYAYGLPQRTFRKFHSKLEGLGSFQDDESSDTILALKQQLAKLSKEDNISQARERQRDIQDVTKEPSSDEDDKDYYMDNTPPRC
ncbi:hypothetical protein BC332_13102 [Capsicum chinense]|nr:hypothetical protein BC332_13102 [Capsicum chinense]